MPVRLGFQIAYRFAQPTPMVAMLDVHDSHAHRLISGRAVGTWPEVALRRDRDRFGNGGRRLLAPAGLLVLRGDALLADNAAAGWRPGPQQPLPEEARMFLQPSRHCEGRPLARHAQLRFADLPSDRVRVRAICAHVARTIEYAPESVDFTRGA